MAKEKTYPLQTLNSDYSDQQKLIGNHGYSQTEYSKGVACILHRSTVTDFEVCAEPKYARDSHPNRQTLQLFKGQAFRLILTFLLAGLEIGTLAVWRHQGNVSHHSKYYFNAVTTALSLALGLNFLVRPHEPLYATKEMMSNAFGQYRRRSKIWPKFFDGGSSPTGGSQSVRQT